MIVVSDTTTISYLLQLGRLSILRQLYGSVPIPSAVVDELTAFHEADELLNGNNWLIIAEPSSLETVAELQNNPDLDMGECAAIVLAEERSADLLIIDEINGRKEATVRGLRIIGLLGVLIVAKKKGVVERIAPIVASLQKFGFRVSSVLVDRVLREVGES